VTGPRPGPQRGQSTVELALVLPVVVLLLLVLLQVGLVARDVVLVAHAAREGARAAAVDADQDAARDAVEASAGLDPDRLAVRTSGRSGPGSRVRVEVVYRIPTNVPVIGHMLGDHTARSAVTMRVEAP
jgi:Flp pilus assembly protein TadG